MIRNRFFAHFLVTCSHTYYKLRTAPQPTLLLTLHAYLAM
jgi:hypothetical protein